MLPLSYSKVDFFNKVPAQPEMVTQPVQPEMVKQPTQTEMFTSSLQTPTTVVPAPIGYDDTLLELMKEQNLLIKIILIILIFFIFIKIFERP